MTGVHTRLKRRGGIYAGKLDIKLVDLLPLDVQVGSNGKAKELNSNQEG